jgi:hypothetical protein
MTKSLELRSTLKRFANGMEERLCANDHKGGWEDCSNDYLMEKLIEEIEELARALEGDGDIFLEACDVANIVMMIADNNSSIN